MTSLALHKKEPSAFFKTGKFSAQAIYLCLEPRTLAARKGDSPLQSADVFLENYIPTHGTKARRENAIAHFSLLAVLFVYMR
jgi:hypothetical protein